MNILIAEDDPVSRRLLEAKLVKWGYRVLVTGNGDEAWDVLQGEAPPQVAILDWMMPHIDGIELCKRVRASGREPYIYIILLTALQQEQDMVTGMDAGADDYITKPFKSNELAVRLRAGWRIVELQNQLIRAREAYREMATHDLLTGLWNHEEIVCILTRELNAVERPDQWVSVIMADIDHFKKVNDSYGHLAGDQILRTTSRKLQSLVSSSDSVGRYGGEEFLIILPGCDRDSAAATAKTLCRTIGNAAIHISAEMVPITISLGVATARSRGRCTATDLIGAADSALYRAKAEGRNRVEVANRYSLLDDL